MPKLSLPVYFHFLNVAAGNFSIIYMDHILAHGSPLSKIDSALDALGPGKELGWGL